MQQKKLIYKGTAYVVTTGKYLPPVIISPIERVDAKYDSPEDAIVNFVSAIIKKDYDWFFSNWTESSRLYNEIRNKEMNRTRDYWIQRWSLTDNKPFEIRYRADYLKNGQTYVIIGYAVKGLMVGDKELEADMVFTKENNKWLGIQNDEISPLLNNIYKLWLSEDETIIIP
jgi:hypothetical protein